MADAQDESPPLPSKPPKAKPGPKPGAKPKSKKTEPRTLKCCVIGCESSNRGQHPSPKLHYFPTNSSLRDEWRSLVNRKAFDDQSKLFTPNVYSRICSKHFADENSHRKNRKPTLCLGYDEPLSDIAKEWVFDKNLKPPSSGSGTTTPMGDMPSTTTATGAATTPMVDMPSTTTATGAATEPMVEMSSTTPEILLTVTLTLSDSDPSTPPGLASMPVDQSQLTPSPSMPMSGTPSNTSHCKPLLQKVLRREAVKRTLHLSTDSCDSSPSKRRMMTPQCRTKELESQLCSPNLEPVKMSTTDSEDSDWDDYFDIKLTPQAARSFTGKTIDDMLRTIVRLREEKLCLKNYAEQLKSRNHRLMKRFMSPLSYLDTDRKVSLYTGFRNLASFEAVFALIKPRAERIRYWQSEWRVRKHLEQKRKKMSAAEFAAGEKTKTFAKSKTLIKGAVLQSRKEDKDIVNRTPRRKLKRALFIRKLSLKEEFLLTLMRIRRGFPEEDLAVRFHISTGTVSKLLITWIKFLGKEFRPLVVMPSREQVKQNLPSAFRTKYPNVKHIIDCAETPIERPSDPVVQYATWSEYKHSNTAKYFVCITPDGLISYVSEAFPGRITDKQITMACGWIDLLEADDEVLADRGFLVRGELLECCVRLRIPVGRRGIDQFSKSDLLKIHGIANTRIHVERAINRIKQFKIISQGGLNLKTAPQLDDILIISSAICNMSTPLIAEAVDVEESDDD